MLHLAAVNIEGKSLGGIELDLATAAGVAEDSGAVEATLPTAESAPETPFKWRLTGNRLLVVISLCMVVGLASTVIASSRLGAPQSWLGLLACLAFALACLRVFSRPVRQGRAFERRLRYSAPGAVPLVLLLAGATLANLALAVLGSAAAAALLGLLLVTIALVLARSWLPPLRRRLVIGDEGFVAAVRAAGGHDGGTVVASGVSPDGGSGEVQPRPYEEVVIQSGAFQLLQDIPLGLRQSAGRVLVASEDELRSPASALRSPIPPAGRVMQRCMDLLVAPLALAFLAPIVAAAILAIVIDSRGAPLFKQRRIGENGLSFTLYKLRTMLANNSDEEHRRYYASLIRGEASKNAGLHKMADDPRVTRVGRFLRHFSIDEVPQLWNVIRGDMGLVGPRPPLPSEVELYDARAYQRLRVKPGLTGLWQVSGRCALGFHEMVDLDVAYWHSWTPLTDLKILLRTPWVVLTGRGAA